MERKNILSIYEFAKLAGVTPNAVLYHVKRGNIPLTDKVVTVRGIESKQLQHYKEIATRKKAKTKDR